MRDGTAVCSANSLSVAVCSTTSWLMAVMVKHVHAPFRTGCGTPPYLLTSTRIFQGGSRKLRMTGRLPARAKGRTMKRLLVGCATAALVSGGMGAIGVGAGIAQAIDDCSPAAMVGAICYGPNHWCPGDSLLYLTQNHVVDPVTWDMN